MKKISIKRYMPVLLIVVVLGILIPCAIKYPWNSIGWQDKFTLVEGEYDLDKERMPYTITNNSNYTYDVTAVIQCNNVGTKWTYERFAARLGPHATDTFYVSFSDLVESKPDDKDLFLAEQNILRLEYKKK